MYNFENNGNNKNNILFSKEEKVMETSNLKNTVILKSVPSNIIEEAIIVLKKGIKIKECQMQNNAEKNDHIIKEAEMIINEYCEKVENSKKKDKLIKKIQRKYAKAKKILIIASIISVIEMIIIFIK